MEKNSIENQKGFIDGARARLVAAAAVLGTAAILFAGGRCEAEDPIILPESTCVQDPTEQIIVVPEALVETHDHDESNQEHNVDSARTFSIIHTVQEGESLSSIADCYFAQGDLGVKSIGSSNQVQDLDLIFPGQKLTVNITAAQTLDLEDPISIGEFSERTGYSQDLIRKINRVPDDGNELVGTVSIPKQRAVISDDTTELVIVQSGQTLYSLAEQSGISLLDLINLNDGNSPDDPDAIKPGNIILVPKEAEAKTSTGENPYQPPEVKLTQFIETYKPTAQKVADEYDLPVEVILAQAVLETGYGESELAVEANNFFGMKAKDDWDGEVYTKITPEEINREDIDKWPDATIVKELEDGRLLINVSQPFRKYDSPEESFKDYGKKITTSGYYDDAVGSDSPEQYIGRLVDGNGPKYATDSSYDEKVLRVVNNIRALEQEQAVGVTIPQPSEAPDQIPEGIMERIESVTLSVDGFREFVASIDRSYMDVAATKPAFNDQNGLESKPFEFQTWHFTTVYVNADGSNAQQKSGKADPGRLINSMNNREGNSCCGIQWFIDRDANVFQFTEPDQRVMHNPPYSEVSTGVELEAKEQKDITSEQYEAAAYLGLYELAVQGKLTENVDLSGRIVGHGEIREIARRDNPSLDVRSDFPTAESVALRDIMQRFIAQPDMVEKLNKIASNR